MKLLDLQIFRHRDYFLLIEEWKPHAIGFSLNYLANIPELVDLAKHTKAQTPDCFIFVGGHSALFTAREILAHAAIACVVRGEGETVTPRLPECASDPEKLRTLPGIVAPNGEGPAPRLVPDLSAIHPARDLAARCRKYFIGVLDPCDRSNSRAAVPGIARFLVRGLFTDAIIESWIPK